MSAAERFAGAAPSRAPTDWHSIDWRKVWRTVRRLQARIVKAVQEGRWGKVKALVYLLTHSFSGRAVAILRVTTNSGAQTPGVDGDVWDSPELKTAAFGRLRRHGYHAQPLRRVYIPKSSDPSKLRPLGIPTVTDRAMEALYLLGLDPILETTADPNSYGFRRERCCADALEQVHNVLGHPHSAAWVLEGDIRACFDRISHRWLEDHVPMDQVILRQWLKAGFLEKGTLFATTEGTPQGGIASPALANRALDGLERLLAMRFAATPTQRKENKVHLIRYADDFVVTGTSKELLRDEVQPLVAHFLSERGLELSHEKTSITRVTEGFDFLGQHIRRYRCGKVFLKPSQRSVRTLLAKVWKVIWEEGGSLTAGRLIERLNPLIRGWALYHRHAASKRTFTKVDRLIFRWLWRWARRRHDRQSPAWVKAKYFPRAGKREWAFTGELPSKEGPPHKVHLCEAAFVRVERHVKIMGAANPYDPAWEEYFEERLAFRMKYTLTGQRITRILWNEQAGKCLRCGEPLTPETGWQHHHVIWRVHGGSDSIDNLVLLHPNCHRQVHNKGLVVAKAASREGRL
jgi:RNA-directed DNA polymerase